MRINKASRVVAALLLPKDSDKVRLTLNESMFYRLNDLADKALGQEGGRAYFLNSFWFEEVDT